MDSPHGRLNEICDHYSGPISQVESPPQNLSFCEKRELLQSEFVMTETAQLPISDTSLRRQSEDGHGGVGESSIYQC